ncbi:MAG: Lrp/AsnC family transcriptional regulator [Candidatus Ranarchaeia archaeon]|jgi:DNA-binding Lrp family transcriptional regulator
MDKYYWKIVEELQKDCRQTTIALASKLGLSTKTVTKRIQTLENEGIIESYTTLVDYPRIGYLFHVAISVKATPEKTDSIMKKIERLEEIHSISYLTGEFNLVFIGLFQNHNQVYDFLNHKLTTIEGISSIQSDFVLYHYFYDKRIEDQTKRKRIRITDLDLKIIDYLRDNARCTYEELASNVGANAQTVIYRTNRLIKNKIIRQFTVILNYWKLGYNFFTYMGIHVLPSSLKTVIKTILTFKDIIWFGEGTKDGELYLSGVFLTRKDLHDFIHNKLTPLPGIQKIRTQFILKKIEHHYV